MLKWAHPPLIFEDIWVIPAQLGKLGAPYVMDFVLLWCIGRYLWEMKNLQILASNSVSFSRNGNLKFRGGSTIKTHHRVKWPLKGAISPELDPAWYSKLVFRDIWCCRIQFWRNFVHSWFHYKDRGVSNWDKLHPDHTLGGSQLVNQK